MRLSLFVKFVIIVTVVIAATDSIMFWLTQKNNIVWTWEFLIAVIIITIIPIVVNLWYWLILKKQTTKNWLPLVMVVIVWMLIVLFGVILHLLHFSIG